MLSHLSSRGALGHVTSTLTPCMGSMLAKHIALPFSTSTSMASSLFEFVHFDVGPLLHLFLKVVIDYVILVDGYSCFTLFVLCAINQTFYKFIGSLPL